ncbi:hypothetical protein PybrP1_009926 [[Pythium] brassicae (nom. inval.)]|nr:hypothetical protein PybrP1_009926 [[Pythium] brassicae (nom. inval.)]
MATPAKSQVLQLYRQLLRVARAFPERSMGAKLQYNTRELIRLRRGEQSAAKVQQFLQEGYDTLRMYQTLQEEPSLLAAITRKKQEEAQQLQARGATHHDHHHLHERNHAARQQSHAE